MTKHSPPPTLSPLRYRLRNVIGRYPILFYPVYGLARRTHDGWLRSETRVTIEGFPRSANSYALGIFQQLNPTCSVASHTHVPAQVIASIKRRLPTLLLIRRPEEAVRALCAIYPQLPPVLVARVWRDFHERLWSWRNGFVLADFTEAVTDMRPVIERINAAFGTTFRAEGVAAASARTTEAITGIGLAARHLPLPSAERSATKRALDLGPATAELAACEEIYHRYCLTLPLGARP